MIGRPSCNKRRMEKFWEKILQIYRVKVDVPNYVVERIATGIILIPLMIIYIWGVFFILPEMLASKSYNWLIAIQILGTWIFLAILSNMHLVRKRNSSIQNRMIPQPVVQHLRQDANQNADVQKIYKDLSEYYSATPFGNKDNYHICADCGIFVPPRTWHCITCRTCIIRRDHHCTFTGCCIGEENLCNFLGLLFYLAVGSTLASGFCLYYALYIENLSLLWYLFRIMCMVYNLLWEFDVRFIIAGTAFVAQAPTFFAFGHYIRMSMKGQTSVDVKKNIRWTPPGQKPISYANLRSFLGPMPFLRIIWPFHVPLQNDFGPPICREEYY